MNKLNLILVSIFLLVAINACSEVEPHTHLWRKDFSQNIWAYLKLKEKVSNTKTKMINDYFHGEVKPGDMFVLEGGIKIKIDKNFIYINNQKIPSTMQNLVIDKDGKITPNAFIRTFD